MYAFKIVKSILWGIPFILSFRFRQNVVQNSQALIDSLYLLKCGTKVEIKTVYGNKTIYDIKDVRIPNQMELNQFHMIGGQAAGLIMVDYFPIILNTPGKKDKKFDLPFDLIFVDRNGQKYEPEVVNAVFNGIEIDTQANYNQNSESSS